MTKRTLVFTIGVAALAALAWPVTERARSEAASSTPSSVVPMPSQQPPPRTRMVVGDTLAIRLRPTAVIGMASVGGGVALAQTTFSSSDSTVATVVNGAIVALDSGIATVTARQVGAQGVASSVVVEVMTALQAVNELVVEMCPNTEEAPFVRRSRPLTVEHDRIHEFHDCQRLIEGNQYSALAGIFAHQNVREHEDWRDYQNGVLVATVINMVGDKQPQVYRPLGLQPGTSCLVLFATSEDSWQATLVPQRSAVMTASGRTYEQCQDRDRWERPPEDRRVLEVKLQYGVDMGGDSIAPPVARWDWDSVHRHNYMGVKCGKARWCEIGRNDFEQSVPITTRKSIFGERLNVIKGYYDQQYLASADGESPTTVFGTIKPGDDIRKLGTMNHKNPVWYDVAEVRLHERARDKTDEYRRYVRQYAGKPLFDFDFLLGKEKDTDLRLRPRADGQVGRYLYTGRLNGKALVDTGVGYHRHSHLRHMPPTVRWRWVHDDERTWSFCDPEGCCESTALLTADN